MRLFWVLLHASSTITLCFAQASTITLFTFVSSRTTTTVFSGTSSVPEIFESPSPPSSTTLLTIWPTTTTTLHLPDVPTSNTFSMMPTPSASSSSSDGIIATTVSIITTSQFSAILIFPTTDALGHSETFTLWSTISSFSVSTTPSPSSSGSQSANQSPSTTTFPISSSTSPPTNPPGKKAVPWVPIVVVLALVLAVPIIWFLRKLVMKRRGRSSGPGRDSEAPRPIISAPILLHQTPGSPPRSPPRRPSRPSSLRGSTIEDMHIIPTLTPVTHLPNPIPETSEVENGRPTSFRPDPLRFYKDGTTNIPLRGDLTSSPQSEAWRPTSSVYSGNNAEHIDMKNTYIPYRGPDSPAARTPRGLNLFPSGPSQSRSPPRIGVHDEALRKLERGEENTRPDTAATVSDGEDDAKSEGSYDWATARAQRLLAEKRKKRESPPIPEKSPLRSL